MCKGGRCSTLPVPPPAYQNSTIRTYEVFITPAYNGVMCCWLWCILASGVEAPEHIPLAVGGTFQQCCRSAGSEVTADW